PAHPATGRTRQSKPWVSRPRPPGFYVPPAEALDDEMRERIAKHRLSRGDGGSTIEEPIELARAVSNVPASTPIVVDCVTLWLSNLMLGAHDLDAAVAQFIDNPHRRQTATIVGCSGVGARVVPATAPRPGL